MRKLAWRVVELTFVMAMIAGLSCLVFASVFSSRPSPGAKELWEERYAADLPPGFSDLRPHWIQHDIGVHIFSVVLPSGMTESHAFDSIEAHVAGYRPFRRAAHELVLRRPNSRVDPAGFDEARFLISPECGRLYAMYSNLDSRKERAALPDLIRELQGLAGSCAR